MYLQVATPLLLSSLLRCPFHFHILSIIFFSEITLICILRPLLWTFNFILLFLDRCKIWSPNICAYRNYVERFESTLNFENRDIDPQYISVCNIHISIASLQFFISHLFGFVWTYIINSIFESCFFTVQAEIYLIGHSAFVSGKK